MSMHRSDGELLYCFLNRRQSKSDEACRKRAQMCNDAVRRVELRGVESEVDKGKMPSMSRRKSRNLGENMLPSRCGTEGSAASQPSTALPHPIRDIERGWSDAKTNEIERRELSETNERDEFYKG